MAYGVTSTTLLLTFGIAPAVASASVHLAEVVTTAASGVSHIKFGNVDKSMVLKLIIPGSIGAFVGACFLSNLPGDAVRPYVSTFLLLLGVYVLFRFLFTLKTNEEKSTKPLSTKQSIPLGLIAGFADATGGGGWGPIATPVLLAKKAQQHGKSLEPLIQVNLLLPSRLHLAFNFSWLGAGKLVLGRRSYDWRNYRGSDCCMVCSYYPGSLAWFACWWVYHFNKCSNTLKYMGIKQLNADSCIRIYPYCMGSSNRLLILQGKNIIKIET